MPVKPSSPFTVAFVAVTLLEMVGDVMDISILHYGCKPLIMALLLLFGRQCYKAMAQPGPIRWLLVGMVFALAGDVFLMIKEVDLFAPGLGAFLIMQVCYSVAFWQSARTMESLNQKSLGLNAIPFMLYSSTFLFVLMPTFAQNSALMALWWPVVLYVVSIMGLLSTQRRSLAGTNWVLTGAILFILSDSFIAIDKFLHPLVGATWLIMTTYAAAQYLIVVGMMQPFAVVLED